MSLRRYLTRLVGLYVLPLVVLAALFAIAHVNKLRAGRDGAGEVPCMVCFVTDVTQSVRSRLQIGSQFEELRRLHGVTLGRETRIAELKVEVNGLLQRLGESPKYRPPGPGDSA